MAARAAPAVAAGARRSRRRAPGWTAAGVAVAVAVCAPLLALPLSFVGQGDALDQIAADLLPDALRASIVLAAGVGAGTLVLGAALAALVSFYDFPDGAGWTGALSPPWPCRPTSSFSCCWASTTSRNPLQQALRAILGDGFRLPEVRSTAGAITVLTLVLYPYVYVLGRTAFLDQSRETRRGRADPRAEPPPRRAAGGPAARPPGARGRRRVGGDGGARRLRRRQPPPTPR